MVALKWTESSKSYWTHNTGRLVFEMYGFEMVDVAQISLRLDAYTAYVNSL